MSNILEYIVNVRDQASDVMSKLAKRALNVSNNMRAMQSSSVRAASAIREMGAPINHLQKHLERLKRERGWLPASKIATIKQYNLEISALEKQINKLETTTGSRSGQWFKEAFQSTPFASPLTNPLVLARAIGERAISLGIQKDLDKTAFNLHLKSEDAAQQMMDDLGKIKMDKAALNLGAKLLLDNKIDGSEILPVMDAIANIAGGAKDKVGSLSLAFAQMNSVGQLNGQGLYQMINAGYNPLVEMSEKTGKSIAQLKDEMSKGGISVQMVKDSFIEATSEGGRFYNYLNMQAETIGGKWGLMMSNVNDKLIDFYDLMAPTISKLLDLGGAAFDATFNGFGWMITKLREGHPVAIAMALALGVMTTQLILVQSWGLAVAGMTKAITAAQWLWNESMMANPVGLVIAAIVVLLGMIASAIYYFDSWGSSILFFMGPIGILINAIMVFKRNWDSIVSAFQSDGILAGLKRIGEVLLDTVLHPLSRILGYLGELTGWDWAKNSASDIDEYRKKLNLVTTQEGVEKGSIFDSLKSSFGISSPNLPGTSTVITNIGGNTNSSTSATAVATGGTKHNYITINLDKLIEVLNITGKDFKESSNNMADATQDALIRVLAMASTAGN